MKQRLNFEPRWLAVIIFFLAGIFTGSFALFIWIFGGGSVYGVQKIHPVSGKYKFINPLLAVERDQSGFFENSTLKSNLNKILESAKKKGVTDSAVYFRDLEEGKWVGINEDQKFSPGKLLKIPIMIAYYKEAESNPKVLSSPIIFHHSEPDPLTSDDLVEGQTYTVSEVIDQMIVYDDASSSNILYDKIDKAALNEVYNDLGINYIEDSKVTDDFLSLKLYSLFYRVLYNATYLNHDYSESALKLLTQTSDRGIAEGLPNDITVAHKYRVRELVKNNKPEGTEYHDCGIVYFPSHPYILCISMNSKDGSAVIAAIKLINSTVYQYVADTYKSNKR
ncbi:MAG: hypothetical protein NVSMB66_6040 [Candidatus Doudnabacteria bacterium]